MNIEIYNYLNLTNYKLAKLYKNGLYNPFPDGFELTTEKIKERLFFSQIQPTLPEYIFEEKKQIKKYFKNSQKNIKNLIKNSKKSEFSVIFNEKFEIYLFFRQKLTRTLLRDFRKQDFDEGDAVLQILNLDPIMGDLLQNLFQSDCDIESLIENLEERYNLSYADKMKLIEKKNNQKTRRNVKKLQEFELKQTELSKEKIQKKEKVTEKSSSKKKESSKIITAVAEEKNSTSVQKSSKNTLTTRKLTDRNEKTEDYPLKEEISQDHTPENTQTDKSEIVSEENSETKTIVTETKSKEIE